MMIKFFPFHPFSMKVYGLNGIEVVYDKVNHFLNVHGSIILIKVIIIYLLWIIYKIIGKQQSINKKYL